MLKKINRDHLPKVVQCHIINQKDYMAVCRGTTSIKTIYYKEPERIWTLFIFFTKYIKKDNISAKFNGLISRTSLVHF